MLQNVFWYVIYITTCSSFMISFRFFNIKHSVVYFFCSSFFSKKFTVQIALAKFWSARGAPHETALMGSWLTISHTCLPCLRSRGVYSLCSMVSYDWVDATSAEIILNSKYGFNFMGSWWYSMEWVWNLRTKLCSIASRKWNFSRVSLQGFDIRYIMLSVNPLECISMTSWMASQSSNSEVQNLFLGGEDMNLLFIGFEGSNEEKMGWQQKEEVL